MGYRTYFYVVERDLLGKIQNCNEIEDAIAIAHPERDCHKECYTSVYKIHNSYEGFEFGKYLDSKHYDHIIGECKELKFFHDEDSHCYVGNQNMVLRAIEWERDRIIENHKKDAESAEEALKSAKSRLTWSEKYLVDTDLESRWLTTSWLYEHQIFNLVNLYKNTDWKKYTVIFAGW